MTRYTLQGCEFTVSHLSLKAMSNNTVVTKYIMKQSFFFPIINRLRAVCLFLENRGEERKTNERANMTSTVSVMYERRCREPLVVWASEDE